MQLELYIAGIGGQGIQLMASVLAQAALEENRHVLLASEYGHMMRGGSSIASVVIGAKTLNALPVLARADAAIIMHHEYLEKPIARLRSDALVVADRQLLDNLPPLRQKTVIPVDAAGVAREVGNPMTAGLAMLSSFCAITGLVRTESLVEAMKGLIPSYRTEHIEKNTQAIRLAAERTTASHPIDLDANTSEEVAA